MNVNKESLNNSHTSNSSLKGEKRRLNNLKEIYGNNEKIDELFHEYWRLTKENLTYKRHILEEKKKVVQFEKLLKSPSQSTNSDSSTDQTFNREEFIELKEKYRKLSEYHQKLKEQHESLKNQLEGLNYELENLKSKNKELYILKQKEQYLVEELERMQGDFQIQEEAKIKELNYLKEVISNLSDEINFFKKDNEKLSSDYAECSMDNSTLIEEKDVLTKKILDLNKLLELKEEEINQYKNNHRTLNQENKFLAEQNESLKLKVEASRNELIKVREELLKDFGNHSQKYEKLVAENKRLKECECFHNCPKQRNSIHEGITLNDILQDETLESQNSFRHHSVQSISQKKFTHSESFTRTIKIENSNLTIIEQNNLEMVRDCVNSSTLKDKNKNVKELVQNIRYQQSIQKQADIKFLKKEKEMIEAESLEMINFYKKQLEEKDKMVQNLKLELKRIKIKTLIGK